MNEIEALLEKAGRPFDTAQKILEHGDSDFAISRAYYGYFYVAEALLLSKGLQFSRHGQVIAQYGRLFARTQILDRRYHRRFDDAFALRQEADYSIGPLPDPGEVQALIEEGRNFLRDAREYIENNPS
jgi:uncharacterized protein (UPF0332 family)